VNSEARSGSFLAEPHTSARLLLRPPQSEECGHARAVRSRRPQSAPQPFQQGNLDGLCGIYALINAIRLATVDQLYLSNSEWIGVFGCLLAQADKHTGATNLVTGGVGARRLVALARYAIDQMADHYGIELTMSRPLIELERPSKRRLVAELRRFVGRPASSVLIGLGGHLNHWTVVRSVGDRSLGLFDSSGLHRIRIDHCRTRHEKKLETTVEHVLRPGRIIRIAVED
jgi:hypothetical protein